MRIFRINNDKLTRINIHIGSRHIRIKSAIRISFISNNFIFQFVSAKYRATAYGIMNMTGVFAGAAVTGLLGKWSDGGELGLGFAMLGIVVLLAVALQLYFLRPKTDNME